MFRSITWCPFYSYEARCSAACGDRYVTGSWRGLGQLIAGEVCRTLYGACGFLSVNWPRFFARFLICLTMRERTFNVALFPRESSALGIYTLARPSVDGVRGSVAVVS